MTSIVTGLKVVKRRGLIEVRFLSKTGRGTQYIKDSVVLNTEGLTKSERKEAIGRAIHQHMPTAAE